MRQDTLLIKQIVHVDDINIERNYEDIKENNMEKRCLALMLVLCLLIGLVACSVQTVNPEGEEPIVQQTASKVDEQLDVEEQATQEPQTTEIDVKYHWDLTPIYEDADAFEQELEKVQQEELKALSAFEGQLDTKDGIIDFMKQKDIIDQKLRRLSVYAMLLTEQNQADDDATAMMQQYNKVQEKFSKAIAFSDPELLANSSGFLDALLKDPDMIPFAEQINRLRDNEQHVLPDETEVLLLPISNAANGASTLFSKLTSADMEFITIKDPDGQGIVIDEPTYYTMVSSNPDREFRKQCSESLLKAYGQYRNTLAQNMDNYVQATVSLAHSHNYATAKEASMATYTVPSEVYDNLITTVNSNLDTAHRYYALRKELLGVDKIYTSDMYYPLVEDIALSFPYEDAKALIVEALAPLGEGYQSNLRKAFDERWIDVYPSDGKSGGAFSVGLNGVHPYVMMNYTDDYNSVSTLAHELGHAMHQYASALNQKSDFNSDPTSFTSEVASTTNELLLADHMIKNAKSDEEKMYYLFSELSTLNNTFFSQAMFSEFEDSMFKVVENGGSLNADVLENLWIEVLKKYDGPDVELTESAQYGWSRIPHFYYDYYVYQYATSIAAACNVTERIESGDEGAVQAYLEFLQSGDSGDGVSLIKLTGVDTTSSTFADALIQRYNGLIDQIEELTNAD